MSRGNGTRVVDYIKKNKLGRVVGTHGKVNPNSGNEIKAWLWEVNEKALREWFFANGKEGTKGRVIDQDEMEESNEDY